MQIKEFHLPADLKVFGLQVKTFPDGIGQAFDALVQTIPGGFDRPYYGIAHMTADGQLIYNATALEKQPGEPEKYGYERYFIEKGNYLTITVNEWRSQIACIKDVFHTIMQDERADKTKPCIEWYKNDKEMLCMVKMKPL